MKIYKLVPVDPENCDGLDDYQGPRYFVHEQDAVDAAFVVLPPCGEVLRHRPESIQVAYLEIDDDDLAGIVGLLNEDEDVMSALEIVGTAKVETQGSGEIGYYIVTGHEFDYEVA